MSEISTYTCGGGASPTTSTFLGWSNTTTPTPIPIPINEGDIIWFSLNKTKFKWTNLNGIVVKLFNPTYGTNSHSAFLAPLILKQKQEPYVFTSDAMTKKYLWGLVYQDRFYGIRATTSTLVKPQLTEFLVVIETDALQQNTIIANLDPVVYWLSTLGDSFYPL